jgi:hypothetical protein
VKRNALNPKRKGHPVWTAMATGAVVLTIGRSGVAQETPGFNERIVAAFMNELQRAVDARDRPRVAAMFQYPVTVLASGLRIPVPDSASLIHLYDALFTPETRCVIDQSGLPLPGAPPPRYVIMVAGDGASIGRGLIWAQKQGSRLKITRMILPPTFSAARQSHRVPRQVRFQDAKYPAQFSGTLVRDDVDSYIVAAKKGQTLQARIDGFRGRDAILRLLDGRTGDPVQASLANGPRIWTGALPATADYRIDVVRLAPYCDAPLVYVLAVTLQ